MGNKVTLSATDVEELRGQQVTLCYAPPPAVVSLEGEEVYTPAQVLLYTPKGLYYNTVEECPIENTKGEKLIGNYTFTVKISGKWGNEYSFYGQNDRSYIIKSPLYKYQ